MFVNQIAAASASPIRAVPRHTQLPLAVFAGQDIVNGGTVPRQPEPTRRPNMEPVLPTLALLAVAMSGIDCASAHVSPGRSLDPAGLFSVTDVDGGFWVYH